jgi:hypothetical protein
MAVAARLNTTYWGLLKQPDNQKAAIDFQTSTLLFNAPSG